MTWQDVPFAHVWTFGFPCQDLSIAGKMAGLFEGERSRLFFEVMRLLDEILQFSPEKAPQMLLAENVEQLKRYLPVLEQEYAKRGYRMSYALYNSKYWGVPQSRERYFVAGVRGDKILQFPYQQTERVPRLFEILETDVPEKYYMPDEKARSIIEAALQKGYENPQDAFTDKDGCAYCLDANYWKGVAPNGVGKGRRTHIIAPEIVVIGRLDIKGKDQWKRVYDVNGLCPTLTAICGGKQEPKIWDEEKFRVRKLTPRECARLQGFPDSYKLVCSDTQMYKQFGNAVTVSVAKAIAETMKGVLK